MKISSHLNFANYKVTHFINHLTNKNVKRTSQNPYDLSFSPS